MVVCFVIFSTCFVVCRQIDYLISDCSIATVIDNMVSNRLPGTIQILPGLVVAYYYYYWSRVFAQMFAVVRCTGTLNDIDARAP